MPCAKLYILSVLLFVNILILNIIRLNVGNYRGYTTTSTYFGCIYNVIDKKLVVDPYFNLTNLLPNLNKDNIGNPDND